MLSIYAKTELHDQLKGIINTEERLNELVQVVDFLEQRPKSDAHSIIIKSGEIGFALDWFNIQPPFLLPEEIELNASHLLGIIFAKLNNYEKAYEYLHESKPSLFTELDFINRMQQGIAIRPDELIAQYSPYEEYRLLHNNAIVRYYANHNQQYDPGQIAYFFEEAIKSAPNAEYEAYTSCQYAQFCMDYQQSEAASKLLEDKKDLQVSQDARMMIKYHLGQAMMQELSVPYDQDLLASLKPMLWEVVEYFEQSQRNVELGMILLDAAHIANISDSFTEALGYISRAVKIFDEESLTELLGNAYYRKGTLLYTWAQNGNPQFFKPAIESYQEALKVFTKEVAPGVFADIHHNLGVLYTDMPSDTKKKSIWAGIAVSSFEEALSYYDKENHPYEYGMICNNYGNAFTKFPQAVLTDNYEKALFYYQEALDVRTTNFPYERAITLLNFLEASWDVGNDPDNFNQQRFMDMRDKAQEVMNLVEEDEMIAEAQKHLRLLNQLEQEVAI